MNNKVIGSKFEHEMCEELARRGWWVHFISPDFRGAQPFDIIAVKDGYPMAIDCKTTVRPILYFERLEFNQIMSFERWLKIVKTEPQIAIKYKNAIYMVDYTQLKVQKKVDVNEIACWSETES